MNDIILAVEEIGMDGSISLIGYSKRTLYRWCKAINEYLEKNHFDWRVCADAKNMCINVKEDSDGIIQ